MQSLSVAAISIHLKAFFLNCIFKNFIDQYRLCQRHRREKDNSLEIPEQGSYGIVGRNGSGKTVLIKCLCGFMSVTESGIWVGEKQVGRDVDFVEDIGFIIETPVRRNILQTPGESWYSLSLFVMLFIKRKKKKAGNSCGVRHFVLKMIVKMRSKIKREMEKRGAGNLPHGCNGNREAACRLREQL